MAKKEVLIVDYGLGNLFNIEAVLLSLGATVKISQDPQEIISAERIIIPGVGAYVDGMRGFREKNLIGPVREFAQSGRPILGICLGMQLLFTFSEEWGNTQGIGLVPGKVVPLSPPKEAMAYKIPHIGWNTLQINDSSNPIFRGITSENKKEFYMYFLHSYFILLEDEKISIATTTYGRNQFCSAFQQDNIWGFQPHPERSAKAGIAIYKNFLDQ